MARCYKGLVLILSMGLLAGCAKSSTTPNAPANNVWIINLPEQDVVNNHTAPDSRSFSPSTLYSLLVAEIAGQRGFSEVTLHHYLQAATKTRDLGIIRQTVDIAEYLNDDESLLRAALLWTQAEPDNARPFSVAFEELIQQNRFGEAAPLLKALLSFGGLEARFAIHTLTRYSNALSQKERKRYLAIFDQSLQASPNHTYFLYAKATLLAHEALYKQALSISQQSIESKPKYTRAILLEAELQDRLGNLDQALANLEAHLPYIDRKKYRNNKEFRLLYIRLLMKKYRFSEAEEQAKIVALKNRHDENVLYFLGVIMLDYHRLNASERYFSLLPDLIGMTGELRFYLGKLAKLRGAKKRALDYFASVDDSRYLIRSLNEIGHILSGAKDQAMLSTIFADVRVEHPYYAPLLYAVESQWLVKKEYSNTALPLLNEALNLYPEDARLLFNRAMLWGKLHNRHNMERDLYQLLKTQTPQISALSLTGNHLGDANQRFTQLGSFKGYASTTTPNDPTVLDSIGWVLHNSGDLKGALLYLKKAYDIHPNPEIAAHLGTVYWKLGQTNLAKKVWDTSLKEHPSYDLLDKLSSISEEDL